VVQSWTPTFYPGLVKNIKRAQNPSKKWPVMHFVKCLVSSFQNLSLTKKISKDLILDPTVSTNPFPVAMTITSTSDPEG